MKFYHVKNYPKVGDNFKHNKTLINKKCTSDKFRVL